MRRVVLLILFNHNYEANLDRLTELYGSRFSHIRFIMPFYRGSREDVISVYGNSFYFQGFIADALQQLKNEHFDYYFFIGDDLYLNPNITEHNFELFFKVDEETAFIPDFFLLNNPKETKPFRPHYPIWSHNKYAINFNIEQNGIEVKKFLPSDEEARQLLKRHGIEFSPEMPAGMFYSKPLFRKINQKADIAFNYERLRTLAGNLQYLLSRPQLPYPLVGSYSDICIIPSGYAANFGFYCGIFASLQLFVEIALPTALAFSCQKIATESKLAHTGETYWRGEGIKECEEKYHLSLNYLNDNFPSDKLYIHPIKLSKWK